MGNILNNNLPPTNVNNQNGNQSSILKSDSNQNNLSDQETSSSQQNNSSNQANDSVSNSASIPASSSVQDLTGYTMPNSQNVNDSNQVNPGPTTPVDMVAQLSGFPNGHIKAQEVTNPKLINLSNFQPIQDLNNQNLNSGVLQNAQNPNVSDSKNSSNSDGNISQGVQKQNVTTPASTTSLSDPNLSHISTNAISQSNPNLNQQFIRPTIQSNSQSISPNNPPQQITDENKTETTENQTTQTETSFDDLLTDKIYPEDLDSQWNAWKCMQCGYVYEGVTPLTKCPKCGNDDPDKFDDPF